MPATAGLWLNAAAAPGGRPGAARVTVLENPLVDAAMIMEYCAGCPAVTVAAGAGILVVKLSAVKACPAEVPPAGTGLVTVTCRLPPWALSAAGTVAVNCVELTNVVASALALKLTTAPETKFAPVTAKIEMAAPALACAGDKDVTVGMGLFTVTLVIAVTDVPAALVTVKVYVAVEVGVTFVAAPLVTTPTPLSTAPFPLLNTGISVVEPPKTMVSDPAVKLVIAGAGTTDRAKLWTASL